MEDTYSFSLPVGGGSGTPFLLEGEGPITAVRLWEREGSYIYGSVSPSSDTFFVIVSVEMYSRAMTFLSPFASPVM